MKRKPRTAVLYGGNSRERKISCLSGMAVSRALRSRDFEVAEIDVREDFLKALRQTAADVAFLALHGAFGEDGQIQEILEKADMPYTGSGPNASRVAMDKPTTKRLLIENGIPTPEFYLAGPTTTEDVIEEAAGKLGYPLVIKPPADGSSLGLSIVHNARELAAAVTNVRKTDPCVLMERFIPGRELTVGILNGQALPTIEIKCHGPYDFKAKYTPGRVEYVVPPELTEIAARALEEVALGTYMCVGCMGVARVDIRLDESDVPYVLEINTIPGLTATSLVPKAAQTEGIEFDELCEMMVTDALEQFRLRTGETVGETKAPF